MIAKDIQVSVAVQKPGQKISVFDRKPLYRAHDCSKESIVVVGQRWRPRAGHKIGSCPPIHFAIHAEPFEILGAHADSAVDVGIVNVRHER